LSRAQILVGDVRAQLRLMRAESVDCVVTSPPYWGLRDYDVEGQIGMEKTLGEHLEVMVDVFREVRRVLKRHGTVWLNYGDSYAAQPNGRSAADVRAVGNDDRTFRDKPFSTIGPIYDPDYGTRRGSFADGGGSRRIDHGGRVVPGGTMKPKDLLMIPNRLAIALQDDGWYVRSEIIWHKPNPMPESVYDRPACAHEKIWLLSRSEDYFYNHEAIREPTTGNAHNRRPGPNSRQNIDRVPVSKKKNSTGVGWGHQDRVNPGEVDRGRERVLPKTSPARSGVRNNASYEAAMANHTGTTRNARNVWTIAPKAFRDAHFATFPPALAERCIKAGVPPTVCGCCGAVSGCGPICATFDRVPGRVLDPFGGAGTVGLVAESLGFASTLIELKPSYAEMAERRIAAARPDESTPA
jgi:DNA modification methylase